MAISRFSAVLVALLAFCAVGYAVDEEAAAAEEASAVLTLDAANFSEAVAKHPFIVVEFYAPWCGHCKKLAPEYEKAASLLSSHDPPIILAKIDANEDVNKEVAAKYEIQGFPTLKIIRNHGSIVQEYKGPREADGIVEYLKKQAGPSSIEIKTKDDAVNFIGEEKIVIVGVFNDFSGAEFDNFITATEKLRSDYDFGHALDANLLPRGDSAVKMPFVRLFKPFDELVVDSKDFDVESLEKFVQTSSEPLITYFDKDPKSRPYLMKYFSGPSKKAMLFVNYTDEEFGALKAEFYEAAKLYKEKALKFLIGDLDASQGALEYFGLKAEHAPVAIVQESGGEKYYKPKVQPSEIAAWLKNYDEGKLMPFLKSEPVPEVNDEPVKVVVATTIDDMVLKSDKNVLIEFYAPWCGHCKKLAPILDEVAVTFQSEPDVVIAKIDATANDVSKEFDVQGYPTLYFSTASGKLLSYDGDRTADDIVNFIRKNKDAAPAVIETAVPSNEAKDEL